MLKVCNHGVDYCAVGDGFSYHPISTQLQPAGRKAMRYQLFTHRQHQLATNVGADTRSTGGRLQGGTVQKKVETQAEERLEG